MKKRVFFELLLVTLLTAFDQFTKYVATRFLKGTEGITLIPGVFRLYFLEGGNSGAAFGILEGKFWFFFISTLVILAGIIWILHRMPEEKKLKPMRYLLLVLSAGALGNFIDRCYTWFTQGHNYVVDFLYFEWIDFPIFNVADCYITISEVLFILLFLFYYKEQGLEWIWKDPKDEGGK